MKSCPKQLWNGVPDMYIYRTVDPNGDVWVWTNKPVFRICTGVWTNNTIHSGSDCGFFTGNAPISIEQAAKSCIRRPPHAASVPN